VLLLKYENIFLFISISLLNSSYLVTDASPYVKKKFPEQQVEIVSFVTERKAIVEIKAVEKKTKEQPKRTEKKPLKHSYDLMHALDIPFKINVPPIRLHGSNLLAQYRVDTHEILIRPFRKFKDQAHYNLIILHECLHAIWGKDELKRDILSDPFFEEIIAHKGGHILGKVLGIKTQSDHAVNHYLKRHAPYYRSISKKEEQKAKALILQGIHFIIDCLDKNNYAINKKELIQKTTQLVKFAQLHPYTKHKH